MKKPPVPTIYFVSSNVHKFQEIHAILSKYNIKVEHKKMELTEPETENIEDIVKTKAIQAFKQLQKPVLTEDTGVYFQAYNNFPGLLAKRIFQTLGYEGLFKLIEGKSREAFFKTSICYMDAKQHRIFTGLMKGTVTEEVHGISENVMPYERIFKPNKVPDKILCFLTREQKHEISHRGQAARKFSEWFNEEFKTMVPDLSFLTRTKKKTN
ncbi:MAG: non-canonical purine NTP pyrophosphatase [Candidatus Diapherotrites archaeon]|nr:non-canonical purine NTP pyrophosphatase [Candidatus Diapherotrites archaeon]